MDANKREWLNGIAERVIGAAYEVGNVLGPGFLEKVYERALVVELRHRGIRAEAQKTITVVYKGETVGEYFADVLVKDELIVELKCVEGFCDEHTAQCLNYLKATGRHLLLLINFQKTRVEWKRLVHDF
jgi:GxxExxY protein